MTTWLGYLSLLSAIKKKCREWATASSPRFIRPRRFLGFLDFPKKEINFSATCRVLKLQSPSHIFGDGGQENRF
jgi:hypothetical protein